MAYEFDETMMERFVAMDLDEAELSDLENEYLEEYDPEEIIGAHREQILDLLYFLEDIETINKEFDPNKHVKEAAFNAYCATIYTVCGLGRRFHPITEYGMQMIRMARGLREEYEKKYLPVITQITADNIDIFASLIENDIAEEIELGRLKGIGLFATRENVIVPAAAVAYRFLEFPEELESGPIIDVSWFFVDESQRERGFCDLLMAELCNLMADKGAESITINAPVNEYYEVLLQIFAEWHFVLTSGVSDGTTFRLGDIDEGSLSADDGVHSFSDMISLEMEYAVMGYLTAEDDIELADYLPLKAEGYYDMQLSCYMGAPGAVRGVALVHQKPSGVLDIEYYGVLSESTEELRALLAGVIRNARAKYNDDALISIAADCEETEALLDEMLPKEYVYPTVSADLFSPGISVTEEDIDELIAV